MTVGARRAGLRISIASEQEFCVRESYVGERGQRRISRLLHADRKATVIITTLYNCGERKRASDCQIKSKLGVDELQQQETVSGSTPVYE